MSVMGTVDMIKAQNVVVVKANYLKPITVSAEVPLYIGYSVVYEPSWLEGSNPTSPLPPRAGPARAGE